MPIVSASTDRIAHFSFAIKSHRNSGRTGGSTRKRAERNLTSDATQRLRGSIRAAIKEKFDFRRVVGKVKSELVTGRSTEQDIWTSKTEQPTNESTESCVFREAIQHSRRCGLAKALGGSGTNGSAISP